MTLNKRGLEAGSQGGGAMKMRGSLGVLANECVYEVLPVPGSSVAASTMTH